METGFFAYGSDINSSGECIEEAIKILNSSNRDVDIRSWKSMNISGVPVVSQVITEIDKCDFFCADLTGLNDNVLFELGYALSKGKPLFIINDTTQIESERKYKELGLLTTIGYYDYTNTEDIIKGFDKERPYDPIDKYWEDIKKNLPDNLEKKAILVLNSQHNTNYNQELVNQINYFRLPSIIDDSSESMVQSMNWYVEQLHSVPSAIIQFSSQTRSGYQIHNSKCALISGMAIGLGLKLQMVAEKPYSIPIDFRDLLKKFSTRDELSDIIKDSLQELSKEIAELLVNSGRVSLIGKNDNELHNISFGETIAEHESNKLFDYYVISNHTENLIKNEYNVVVGRKGTGKTATLYYLNEYLGQDIRNNIILIKPVNFEVDGLISLMEESNSEFEKGFLIESIWKFLIYTEIAKFLYYKVSNKPLYALDDVDNEYIAFIKKQKSIYLSDFSTRLEEQLKVLKANKISEIGAGKNNEFRLKVSELLHDDSIKKMKEYFAKIVTKKQKLIVLIDNLDKSWRKDSKLNILSKYLLGLLGVSGRIFRELSFVKSVNIDISFHLTIFLRSDIFKEILYFAREPDKIEVTRLNWEDSEKLFRIIENRFIILSKNEYNASDLWESFITKKVGGIDTKKYISSIIFPRPRDIIYFFRTCKEKAVSRGHDIIEESDIISTHIDYSSWVFKSILVENAVSYDKIEDFMYEMMMCNEIITEDEIVKFMKDVDFKIDNTNVEKFIDHLVSLTVIGREISKNEFRFEYNVNDFKKYKKLASKHNSKKYKVHNALIPYLECKTNTPLQ